MNCLWSQSATFVRKTTVAFSDIVEEYSEIEQRLHAMIYKVDENRYAELEVMKIKF